MTKQLNFLKVKNMPIHGAVTHMRCRVGATIAVLGFVLLKRLATAWFI